jgi:hypothetical protein
MQAVSRSSRDYRRFEAHIVDVDPWLLDPPLRTVAPFNGLVTAIENHDDTKLKLKCIPSCERPIEHVDRMMKRDFL